jgi:hypothetical protein
MCPWGETGCVPGCPGLHAQGREAEKERTPMKKLIAAISPQYQPNNETKVASRPAM